MSQQQSTNNFKPVPETEEKLLQDDKLMDTGTVDSGFLSGGNLQENSFDEEEEILEVVKNSLESEKNKTIISEEEIMRSKSNLIATKTNESTLGDVFAKLDLRTNDLNNPKKHPNKHVETIRSKNNDLNYSENVPWEQIFEQDEDGDTILHLAIFHRDHEGILSIIRATPHPSFLDTANDGLETPLHLAAKTGQFKVIRWLIIAGARPSPRDLQGNSPLHIAVKNNDLKSVRAIIEPISPRTCNNSASFLHYKKPNLDQWNYIGQSCALLAAEENKLEILQHLVAFGADINARCGLTGWTALHFAVFNRNEEMVKFLLTKCDPQIISYSGKNAWNTDFILPSSIVEDLRKSGLESPVLSEDDDNEEDEDEEEIEELRF